MRWISLVLLVGLTISVWAEPPAADPSRLTLDRIFVGDEFQTERVPTMRWLEGSAITKFEPSKTVKNGKDFLRVDIAGKSEVLVPAEKLIPEGSKDPLDIQNYEISRDLDVLLLYTNSKKVWRQNTRGDYWTYHRSTGKLVKHGGNAKPSTVMFAKVSPDGKQIGYVRENNLYVEPVDGGAPVALTTDGSAEIINGTFDWVYEEEFNCRDGWRWSPDSKTIAYWQLNTQGMKNFTLVDNTRENYPVLTSFPYPKTGEQNALCRIGVVPAGGGTTKWIEVPGDTRHDFYIPTMTWAGNSTELLLIRINRLQNALDVLLADVSTGTTRKVLTERDGAWVDIPEDVLEPVENDTAYTWISEQDGWRHLYVASRDGNTMRRITAGDYDVIRVLHVDKKTGLVYFIASPDNARQHYLYRTNLSGNTRAERVSPADQSGWHDYNISSDGTVAVHTFSSFGTPPRVELISLPDHKVIRVLATNEKLAATLGKLARTPHEFFQVEAPGGTRLEGWLLKPPGFDPAKKYPLMFYVYGEPAGQNVTDRWGGSQYLWHLMLAQQGYVVACVDNRGTPCPKGRDWRKVVYRRIGVLASEDQASAARELLKRPYLDSKRVGVWGWSGGGSMTLNLLFRHPEIYRTGMAVAPVPDMRLYDTIYQERYMGLPQDNAEDYTRGSPISHAAGLKGNLLIVHGSGDDNCHYQGTEKLADKLIELNKSFTLMPYPNRSHSVNEGKNTTRHLYGLLTRYLTENLPPGAN